MSGIQPIRKPGEPPICSATCPQYNSGKHGLASMCDLYQIFDHGEVCVPAVLEMQAEIEAARAERDTYRESIADIGRVACGEDQVGFDDTEGMEWVYQRCADAAAEAAKEKD